MYTHGEKILYVDDMIRTAGTVERTPFVTLAKF